MTEEKDDERRGTSRVNREQLPKSLQTMIMETSGKRNAVTTYDASTVGIGLAAPISPESLSLNTEITLLPGDGSFRLQGRIAFITSHGGAGCRLGIQLASGASLDHYRSLLSGTD